jgi:hypothetical protein
MGNIVEAGGFGDTRVPSEGDFEEEIQNEQNQYD